MILDTRAISQILPHAYPFLLVDKILELDIEAGVIVGQKNVTRNEEFFQGHFPTAPIMPGVLILEALAQTGGVLIHEKGYSDSTALLLTVDGAKFRRGVFPGDILILRAQALHLGSRGGKVEAQATVDGHIAVEAEIGFALRGKEQV